jgi:hypothetical protein
MATDTTLDFSFRGQPFVVVAPSDGTVTTSLDFSINGEPFYAPAGGQQADRTEALTATESSSVINAAAAAITEAGTAIDKSDTVLVQKVTGASGYFGNYTQGSSLVYFPPANNKAVMKLQNTTGQSMLVSKFVAQWYDSNPTAKNRAVLYTDNAGVPDQLLAVSNELVGITLGVNILTFPFPVQIPAGGYVWAGVIGDTGLTADCLTGGTIAYNADTYSGNPSQTFGSYSTAAYTYPMTLYGTDGLMRFGRSSIDRPTGNYQPDREHGDKFTLDGTASVLVSSISTYILNTEAGAKSKAAIFTDVAGAPGVKLAQTNEVTGATANSWLVLPFATDYLLAPGTYWLCFITDTNLQTTVIPYGGFLKADGVDTEVLAFQSPSTLQDDISNYGIDIYATYTISTTVTASVTEAATATESSSAGIAGTASITEVASASEEILADYDGVTNVVNSQQVVEVLRSPSAPNVRNSQEVVEVVRLPTNPIVRLSQEVVEVVRIPTTMQVKGSQVVVEVLRQNISQYPAHSMFFA